MSAMLCLQKVFFYNLNICLVNNVVLYCRYESTDFFVKQFLLCKVIKLNLQKSSIRSFWFFKKIDKSDSITVDFLKHRLEQFDHGRSKR